MLRTREMGFSPNPAVYISPPCQESRKLKTKIFNLVGQMSHDDQLDWSSVHILTREKIIHLRKAGEIPLCRGSSPQLCFLQEATHLVIQVYNCCVLSLHMH